MKIRGLFCQSYDELVVRPFQVGVFKSVLLIKYTPAPAIFFYSREGKERTTDPKTFGQIN